MYVFAAYHITQGNDKTIFSTSMLVASRMNLVRERYPYLTISLSSFFDRSRCVVLSGQKSQGSAIHIQNKAAASNPNRARVAMPISLKKEEPRVGEAKYCFYSSPSRNRGREEKMGKSETVRNAEKLVETAMKGNDASHDAAHAFRVRDLALSLAREEGLSSSPDSMEIVELAALLHDIGDYKYVRDPSEENMIEDFLEAECIEETKRLKILSIIKGMGFKEELSGHADNKNSLEFGVVQDADRLDAIGAIGIARCFTFGGSRNNVLFDPSILPRSDLVKEQYMEKNKQTTVNHFHEKLLKLKDLMKTKAGKRRAEKRHKFMENFLKEFYEEWDGRS